MAEGSPAPTAQPPRSGVFRTQAIEGLSAPSDQLDRLLRVTSPRGWLALSALVAVVVAAVVYGFVGQVPTTVSGQGIFLPPGGLTRVDAPTAGTVSTVHVKVGETIATGARVAAISDDQGRAVQVLSTLSGTVTEVLIDDGNFVAPGSPLAVVEPASEAMTAVVYVPGGQGKAIRPGMTTHLSPATAPSEQYGQIMGTVTAVSEFPVSSRRLDFVLQDDLLEREIAALGPVLEVTVAVTPDADTLSKLAWTSGQGPPFQVSNGTSTTVSVILSSESPARKLFDPRE